MVYNKDQKGPITAISHVLGFLVSAVGQKVNKTHKNIDGNITE